MWLGSGWERLGESGGMPASTVQQRYTDSLCNTASWNGGLLFGTECGFPSCLKCWHTSKF